MTEGLLAAINEVGEWFEFNQARPPFNISRNLPNNFYNLELREKWLRLPDVIRQKTFQRSSEPWQSFEVLVELRFLARLSRPSITGN